MVNFDPGVCALALRDGVADGLLAGSDWHAALDHLVLKVVVDEQDMMGPKLLLGPGNLLVKPFVLLLLPQLSSWRSEPMELLLISCHQ